MIYRPNEPTEDDLVLARDIVTSDELFAEGEVPEQYLARILAEQREQGRQQGLVECEGSADDAHAAGYAEGLEAAGIAASVDAINAYTDGLGNR